MRGKYGRSNMLDGFYCRQKAKRDDKYNGLLSKRQQEDVESYRVGSMPIERINKNKKR